MRVYNRYLMFLISISGFVNTLLTFFGQDDLNIYLLVNMVFFLVLTLIFMPSNPKAKKAFNTLNLIYFTGFLFIVVIEFMDVISGT